ncbi:hypothetical protein EQW78_09305 [Oerskovia turbata]|uniref:SAF domain-containing protein n=1 Tax=Oerskovia turbata TaxID=1713 RepID=A0A4V1N545_9CELL|nr:hypothetical protein [Oerskovia turbata]RXR26689.1 hypothetical protein EQW73_04080 [Oerskovia turbata]RXR34386.1 hypothetical protein EQW78_09305 [Oerskovia turbata]TGJ97698.1 hypothetical protein DLJ96_07150 [Actinotalea fermentans ATCC 43279 = JCM 9966 = DSM 3133]
MTTSLDALPSPTVARLRRPGWRDPRLLLGLVLVAASVALGSWAVSSASRTVAVYAAAGPLTPGEPVDASSLRVVEVRLGSGDGKYFLAGRPLPDDLVALRVVGDGELVARSAVGGSDELAVRAVAIPVAGALSDRVTDGALVDVWFVPAADGGATAPDRKTADAKDGSEPYTLAAQVVVAQVAESGGTLVSGGPTTLHVLVPTDELPGVLAALAAEGEIAVVPVAGGSA